LVRFGSPSGSPTLTLETDPTLMPTYMMAADVGIPATGGSFGPYSSYLNAGNACSYGGLNFAYQVVIPEPE
jgi:hypothetical protein